MHLFTYYYVGDLSIFYLYQKYEKKDSKHGLGDLGLLDMNS